MSYRYVFLWIASHPQTSFRIEFYPCKSSIWTLLLSNSCPWFCLMCVFQLSTPLAVVCGKSCALQCQCSQFLPKSKGTTVPEESIHKLSAKLSIARSCSSPKSRRRTCWSISGRLAKWKNDWAVLEVWRLICTILVYHNLVADKVPVQMARLVASCNSRALVVQMWLETLLVALHRGWHATVKWCCFLGWLRWRGHVIHSDT